MAKIETLVGLCNKYQDTIWALGVLLAITERRSLSKLAKAPPALRYDQEYPEFLAGRSQRALADMIPPPFSDASWRWSELPKRLDNAAVWTLPAILAPEAIAQWQRNDQTVYRLTPGLQRLLLEAPPPQEPVRWTDIVPASGVLAIDLPVPIAPARTGDAPLDFILVAQVQQRWHAFAFCANFRNYERFREEIRQQVQRLIMQKRWLTAESEIHKLFGQPAAALTSFSYEQLPNDDFIDFAGSIRSFPPVGKEVAAQVLTIIMGLVPYLASVNSDNSYVRRVAEPPNTVVADQRNAEFGEAKLFEITEYVRKPGRDSNSPGAGRRQGIGQGVKRKPHERDQTVRAAWGERKRLGAAAPRTVPVRKAIIHKDEYDPAKHLAGAKQVTVDVARSE